jgi:hypothetical protein
MRRYRLSKIFTEKVEPFLSRDGFFGMSAAQNMRLNRDHYRDAVIEGVQKLYFLFNSNLQMQAENTGIGTATLKVSSTQDHYLGYSPAEIKLSTECSDLLLALGREAAFCLESDGKKEIIYYGNSYNPDNDSQRLNMPNHIGDIKVIASEISRMTYASLYKQYQKNNGARPLVIDM